MRRASGKVSSSKAKSTHGVNSLKNETGRGSDDIIMYDSRNCRVVPKHFVRTKSKSTAQYTNTVDHVFLSAAGEERAVKYDERLIIQTALQDLNQPKLEAALPDGLITVHLFRHQGLGKTTSMMQKLLQSKTKPEDTRQTAEALNLDDDEDREITVLDDDKRDGEAYDINLLPQAITFKQEFRSHWPQAGTLVVCPASVLRYWARELVEKVAEEARFNVLIYHGSNRTKDPGERAAYDAVLTTYTLVMNELPEQSLVGEEDDDPKSANKRRKNGKKGIDLDSGALARVRWHRIILDEAQTIKNHRTQVARACCTLKAKVRWCLPGTPI